jgi:hypothetical protein
MKTYAVYRVEYLNNKTVKVGTVVDYRRAERNNNATDMLRIAQKLYSTSSVNSHIFILRENSRLRMLFEDPLALRLQQDNQ